ncbi:MAG: hypothetical protein Q9206_000252 [Seirophora lacunosa]
MSKQEYWDDQRVGFDDSETLAGKTNCAAEKCFGGTMIWSLDMDSSHGSNRPVIRLILNLDDGRRTPATVPTADTSATSSSGARGQTVPVAPVAPVAAAPGKSTNTASGTKSPSRSTISSQTGSSKKSSSISVSFSATGSRPSGQSTGATSQGQALPAALMIPGIAPVPSPMLAPELMVTKEAVQDFTIFNIKPQLFDSMRKASPDINSVLKTGISSLSKSIKNPGQVNVQDIAKANSLLGKHGPETQQVASTFKQLTGRELPRQGQLANIGVNKLSNAVKLLTSATKDVGGLGAALDLSLADAYELNARFPPQDLRKVVQAQTAIKALSAELKPILNDLAQFITETGQSLQAIKRHAPKFVIRESPRDGILAPQSSQHTLQGSSSDSKRARVERSLSSKMNISLIRNVQRR